MLFAMSGWVHCRITYKIYLPLIYSLKYKSFFRNLNQIGNENTDGHHLRRGTEISIIHTLSIRYIANTINQPVSAVHP